MNTEQLLRGRRAIVLLVEDNSNDVELTKIAFETARFSVELHHVGDGEECLAFLRKEGRFSAAPMPDLVLLDLHMPRMNGLEVLEAVTHDPRLKHLPIVVLTTSESDSEMLEAYQLRCSGYLVKPVGFANFAKVIQGLEDYWFTLVVLPPDASSSCH